MALQTSGEISLFDIRDEFGQSNPVNLLDYYRGGGIVPDIPDNSSVPTSGSISVQDFYGATDVVDATGGTTSIITEGGNTYRVHQFTSNGTFTVNNGGTVEYLLIGGGAGGGMRGGGGGGGAAIQDAFNSPGGHGGSGTVIIRYII